MHPLPTPATSVIVVDAQLAGQQSKASALNGQRAYKMRMQFHCEDDALASLTSAASRDRTLVYTNVGMLKLGRASK